MAMTELQLPNKDAFFVKLQDAATRMDRIMMEWASIGDFIGAMDAGDLDSMGVAMGAVRTDLIAFRTAINEILALWEGEAVSAPSISPRAVVDKIRFMS